MDHLENLIANLCGNLRRETLHGRQYIVAPMTLIVPGVLNGSQGALYYPPEEVSRNAGIWNGMPLMLNHPNINGQHVSARSPEVLERYGLGTVFNDRYENGRRIAEGWFDVEKTRRIAPQVLQNLESGRPIELSTGLYTDNLPAQNGASHQGQQYSFVARNYRPDHVAILPDQKGACSLEDGCGVNVKNARKKSTTRNCRCGKTDCGGKCLKKVSEADSSAVEPVSLEDSMEPLTAEQRKKVVNSLTTNCACQEANIWNKDDAETLNELSDKQLISLAKLRKTLVDNSLVVNSVRETLGEPKLETNAIPEFLKKRLAGKKAAPEEDLEEEPEEDGEDMEMNNRKPANNASRLTAEEREDLAFARREKNRLKQTLINKITANTADDEERAEQSKILNQKNLDELQFLAKLIPSQPEALAGNQSFPVYFGAAAPVANSREAERFNTKDVLEPPTANFRAWKDEERKSRVS